MRIAPFLVNGQTYNFWAQHSPPHKKCIPWAQVHMKRCDGLCSRVWPFGFIPVEGKVDTGADCTALRESTGVALGIADIMSGDPFNLYTANGQAMQGYVHSVFIELRGSPRGNMTFPINAVFSAEVEHNLFGRDWLKYVCIGMDHNSAHFMVG